MDHHAPLDPEHFEDLAVVHLGPSAALLSERYARVYPFMLERQKGARIRAGQGGAPPDVAAILAGNDALASALTNASTATEAAYSEIQRAHGALVRAEQAVDSAHPRVAEPADRLRERSATRVQLREAKAQKAARLRTQARECIDAAAELEEDVRVLVLQIKEEEARIAKAKARDAAKQRRSA